VFVLGVDPGVSRCGYSVIERVGSKHRAVAIGVLTTPPSQPLPLRLAELAGELAQLFDEYRPDALALERVLFQVNTRTAMSVGQVSGLAMVEAARRGLPVTEYSPNQVKDAVVGYGAATKDQVGHMVATILGLSAPPRPADAADAAAVALCHLSHASLLAAAQRSERPASPPRVATP
jgi:crossover junction endodeoxyribonuclease RuvC